MVARAALALARQSYRRGLERDLHPIMIGDPTYAEKRLQRDHVPAIGEGDLLLCASFAKVRALKQRMPGLVILPAHDPTAAEKLRTAG